MKYTLGTALAIFTARIPSTVQVSMSYFFKDTYLIYILRIAKITRMTTNILANELSGL